MLSARYQPYQLTFKQPVLTSRGAMAVKNGYYLLITDGANTGVGECSFIEGLSIDDIARYPQALDALCAGINKNGEATIDISRFPALQFAYETALLDLQHGGRKILFESDFTLGLAQIPINGLVWMGGKEFMLHQLQQKLADGFKCIKIKVGAIDFDEEVALLKYIRAKFPASVIEIRLDANGAFTGTDVFKKLETLAQFQIHSIEQPVKQGQPDLMQTVCARSPIPVALDEELIGVVGPQQQQLLQHLKPAYIILKPSLLGGLAISNGWIEKAEALGINWWATSALEGNIGLNAIAQWVYTTNSPMVQGLGTGSLYTNNISSPLYIAGGHLGYNAGQGWGHL
jgi:o-succinylbenzoate synthase